VVADGDRAGSTLGLADGPVLSEGARTGDRWLVGAGISAHGVGATIGLDAANGRGAAAGIVGALVLLSTIPKIDGLLVFD
jgi:hypothetical protein